MVTGPAVQVEIHPSLIGTLELAGFEVPYVDLENELFVHTRLRVGDTEYTYERSYPIKGHSAVMPGAIAELQAQGRRVLVAERNERYLVYVA